MKARKRFMAIALSGAMMLSVTGCGSTATGDVQTLENPEIMSKSDEELSDVLENLSDFPRIQTVIKMKPFTLLLMQQVISRTLSSVSG